MNDCIRVTSDDLKTMNIYRMGVSFLRELYGYINTKKTTLVIVGQDVIDNDFSLVVLKSRNGSQFKGVDTEIDIEQLPEADLKAKTLFQRWLTKEDPDLN